MAARPVPVPVVAALWRNFAVPTCMISIIIPTFNEKEHIGSTIRYLLQQDHGNYISEIIVADGGSSDATVATAEKSGAKTIKSHIKGRAAQMNVGAAAATGAVLYFLHADTVPPKDFTQQILEAYQQGFACGCFRLQFDHRHWFLQANCWFTRFNIHYFRFGDQSLFVDAALFKMIGGFNEKLMVLEDQEIVKRLVKRARFKVMRGTVITSARKYVVNGIYKTQAVYFLIYFIYQ